MNHLNPEISEQTQAITLSLSSVCSKFEKEKLKKIPQRIAEKRSIILGKLWGQQCPEHGFNMPPRPAPELTVR